jgi:outer membrane protein assembly factor BamB
MVGFMYARLISICNLILFVVISGICAAEWPAFRGNMQRTGSYPEHVGFPGAQPDWTSSLGCAIVSSPSVQDNTLFVGGRDSCFYAIDTRSGKVLWKKKTGGWVDSSPLLFGDTISAGSRDGNVYLLDRNGRELKRLAAGLQLSSPARTIDGQVVTGMGPPLDGFSGFATNTAGLAKASDIWSLPFTQMSYSSPAVFGQACVIGANDGNLYMIDTHAKKIVWRFPTGGGVYLSTPAIDKEQARVYFAPGNYDRNVYALDLLTGAVVWASEGAQQYSLSKRLADDGAQAFPMLELMRMSPVNRRNTLAMLRNSGIEATGLGKKLADREANGWSPLGDMKTSSVAVGPDLVYVVQKAVGVEYRQDNGNLSIENKPMFTLLALNKRDGKEVWRFSELRNCITLGYSSSPVVTPTSVIVGWGEGAIHMLAKETGERLWSDTLDGDIIASPAIADGTLYIATMAGTVYSYRLSQTQTALDFKRSTYCYPNPARKGVSHIQVYVARDAALDMTIFNMAERPVMHINERLQGDSADHDGRFTYDWDLKNVANGIYFTRIVVKYNDGGTDKKVLKIAVLK